ncbi:hypothetical protein V6N12_028479 [Hibiscus sabdariffa]|uniref:Uncharacterized protein n=1 Tax=Hibiscus sabdariffa TaxID=183260 RepID=A0ABR2F627_9ROSI
MICSEVGFDFSSVLWNLQLARNVKVFDNTIVGFGNTIERSHNLVDLSIRAMEDNRLVAAVGLGTSQGLAHWSTRRSTWMSFFSVSGWCRCRTDALSHSIACCSETMFSSKRLGESQTGTSCHKQYVGR